MITWKLLAAVLLLAPVPACAEWYEASTKHFVVYSEQRPEPLKDYASELERFDTAMRFVAGRAEEPVGKANRVTVYVVDDGGDVVKLARTRGIAGFYIPRAGGSLAIVPRSTGSGGQWGLNAQQVLQHEYTHHLMWSLWPHAVFPSWYVEGFAETFATTIFRKDGSVELGGPPLYRAYGLMAGNPLPMEKMLVAESLKLRPERRDVLYGRGWLLIHYVMLGGARKGELLAYLDALNSGKAPLEAAKAFGDLRALDKELDRYKLSRKLNVVRLGVDKVPMASAELRKLTPGEAAVMNVRIRSKVGVNRETAPGVYEAARKAAARYPDDPGAQCVLAEAAYDALDYAGAEAAADRAVAADPKALDGHLYKAMVKMAVARGARDRRPATLAAIRKVIGAANRLDPDDPRPLVLYFRSYVDFGQVPTDMAKRGLLRAFDLAPQDKMLRFNAARTVLRDGNKAEARRMLGALAFEPHGGTLAHRAAGLIAQIDAGDAEGAAKAMDDKADDSEPEDADPA